ncbi:MAG: N-6 DNA methylase [Myxococcus sp.]|nr:N-6 DNA methylase [Myxococcus sp.]
MSSPQPVEEQLLARARAALNAARRQHGSEESVKLEILEGAASRLGGFSLAAYRRALGAELRLSTAEALDASDIVLRELKTVPIHPSLALCALARPDLRQSDQKKAGVYYTDFRLAQYLVKGAGDALTPEAQVIDPACGTGILLVAAALQVCAPDRHRTAKWLAENVTAADMSADAIRGARLALASLSDDVGAVGEMARRWRCHDSLLSWSTASPAADVVLANPPWEKVKLSRHEFLQANGEDRHYGAEYASLDERSFAKARQARATYGNELAALYPLLGDGEADLYKAFLDLFLRIARPGGCVSVLVPAGLIRSQGTQALRAWLFERSRSLGLTVFENRARFFSIDTRFKFLAVSLTRCADETPKACKYIEVVHGEGTDGGVRVVGRARIARSTLAALRPDLTVPEVRSEQEWKLFRQMSERSERWDLPSSEWHPQIVREIDMTRERPLFERSSGKGLLPVVEGRMVHQHRFGAKVYRSGTGRKALWETVQLGEPTLGPQFRIAESKLTSSVSRRASMVRAGFCDITGQTNERSMLAAMVPAGVVCGNKVPTVTFPADPSEERLFAWTAIVNSIPFDWALRRIVTTTVNYFLLLSVPFPALSPSSLPGRRLVEASAELVDFDAGKRKASPWRVAELRAAIDVVVLRAYGLEFDDLALMLRDFPLLDRGQPPLPGEDRSTVTRDLVLTRAAEQFGVDAAEYGVRLGRAKKLGALPYIPSEFAGAGASAEEEEVSLG